MTEGRRYACFETAQGWCGVAWSARGVTRFRLPEGSQRAVAAALAREATPGEPPHAVAALIDKATRYFSGEAVDFDEATLDLDGTPEFSQRLYAAIRRLRRGETTTYGALAEALGAPKEAARAVGQAMGANPVPLIAPCHRVLAAGGKLGGFSGPGGARQKAQMLTMEGARIGADDPAQGVLRF
jgi:methylated-DNA-[protein]-cysteine S-methyltransferase